MGTTLKTLESRINGLEAKVLEQGEKIDALTAQLTTVADLVASSVGGPVQITTKGGGKVGVTYVLHSAPTEGVQPQARKCMRLAVEHFGLEVEIDEKDLVAFLRSKQQEISANQDSWSKVFCFYRKRLEEMGALTWNK